VAGASIIHVDGVRLLFLNFAHCTIAQAPALLAECGALVRSQPLGSALTLSDFTGSQFDSEVTALLRQYTEDNRPHVHFGAVVGITGFKRAVYRLVLFATRRTNLVVCDTIEEAQGVLVEAARKRDNLPPA
jgi:hypothetical protein